MRASLRAAERPRSGDGTPRLLPDVRRGDQEGGLRERFLALPGGVAAGGTEHVRHQ